MMNAQTLSTLQLLFMIILSIGLMNHVIIIPFILEAAHRDAWIATLGALGGLVIWLPLLYFIIKQLNGERMFDWLKNHFSSPVAYVTAIVSSIFLLLQGFVTLSDTITFTTTSYLTTTPRWVLILVIALVCFYNAYRGIDSIANTAMIICPFVIAFGLFVMLSTIPHKDYSLLKPMLEHGMTPVFRGMLYVGAGYVEIIVLLFLSHRLPRPFSWKALAALVFFTAGLTIGPTLGAIAEFGPEQATRLRYPSFEQWRMVNLGTYIEHVDFLSVYQWLSGAFIRISLSTALIVELFPIRHLQTRRWMLIVLYLAITLASLTPGSDEQFLYFVKHWVLPSSLLFSLALSVLLGALALLTHRKKKRGMAS
ncbi:GerAB/ArcD/ProY family transporter [Geobacillus thermodenitrificans]|uniref:GerAB/ArcD/ProY family transporter n=1 Tax=Geobacillus thermodenitrificans TaxID=33940 RepID=UPI000D35B7BD|nr:endospore germination permease [Geobacillus thermodenitrificans]PTR48059.1 spore gernimation protein [Geobacillus thermodenitrificans]